MPIPPASSRSSSRNEGESRHQRPFTVRPHRPHRTGDRRKPRSRQNAGTCYHNQSWDVTEQQWDDVFDLNIKALWACSLAVGSHMRERGSGSVVNIGSMSGLIVNRPQMQPAYNASKAAVLT